jgi:NTE family protein/lysophospholipid hydrolase
MLRRILTGERSVAVSNALSLFRKLYDACLKQPADALSVVHLLQGQTLFHQGDPATAFWIVVEGELEAIHDDDGASLRLATMSGGEIVGEIGALGGAIRTASVSALQNSRLLEVPATALASLAESHPELTAALDDLIHTRVRRSLLSMVLPRMLGELDDTLLHIIEERVEWVALQGGDVLFEQGSSDDSLYLVVSGRLQAVRDDANGPTVVAEMHRGDAFGEIALITGQPRSAAIRAVRDSELARVSKATFEEIAAYRPEVYASVAKVVVHWLVQGRQHESRPPKTFAIIPATSGVDAEAFAKIVADGLAGHGTAEIVARHTVASTLNADGMPDALPGSPQQTMLELWLEEWEQRSRWTFYIADATETEWTRRCIRRADQRVWLVDPSQDLQHWADELIAATGAQYGQDVLVLTHPGTRTRVGAAAWLERTKMTNHLHLRAGVATDAARVGRCLTGLAVGLVLGGGGARGFAHIGVIRAMRELGIPIDRVGGTSMGAIVGGMVAMDATHEEIVEASRQTFLVDRVQDELTLPMIALNASQKLNKAAQRTFRGASVEDLPLSFFCVSCDITAAQAVIHQSGPVWKATRASGCLPGVFVPVIQDGHLLVDGGIMNNLPGDVMRKNCGTVIVVDVSPNVDMVMHQAEFPSPWALLRSRINPMAKTIEVPSIVGMLTRAAMVASARVADKARENADIVVQPPIQEFGLLDFDPMERIIEVGYRDAMNVLAAAIDGGPLEIHATTHAQAGCEPG